MKGTPSIQTMKYDALAAADGGSSGGGRGAPGISPAIGERAAAQTSARASKRFLIDSPLVTLPADIADRLCADSTTFIDHDETEGLDYRRALFARLYREGRLDEALTLCAEAFGERDADAEERAAWTCNLSILKREAGDNVTALALLTLARPHAEQSTPLTLAKFHNGLGRTYENLKDYAGAIEAYTDALRVLVYNDMCRRAGHPLVNIGRALALQGRVDEARAYLRCAARIAAATDDYLLLGEIGEEGAKL